MIRSAARRIIAALLITALVSNAAIAESDTPDEHDGPAEPDGLVDDLLLFPEYRLEYDATDGVFRRTWRRTANESVSFVNETLSDAWTITKSPLDWRWQGWLTFAAVAGGATALIYLGDEEIRDHATDSTNFRKFGGKVGFLSDGTAFAALTGGFLLSGALLRDKEIQTAKMLMESTSIGYGYAAGLKYVVGRRRPGPTGPRDFQPFSGQFSMPSGETTHAFTMAAVIAEQYPNWPVRIASYGLATTVAAGRIARDDHWTSDVFVAAALGTFVGRSVSWLHHERDRRRHVQTRLGIEPDPLEAQHSLHVGTRSVGWTVRY